MTAACALALALVSASCPKAPEPPPIVVWIEVDTLRADALGCYGNPTLGEGGASPSPNIDALARDGVRFERAYSAAPWTIPSLVTQLSGLWPWEHGATHLLEPVGEAHTALVPLLQKRGVRTAGVMTNFVATHEYGFSRGFERWDESFATGHLGATSNEALQRLLAFADELGGGKERALFLMGWLFEPHYLYESHAGLRFGPGHGSASAAPYAGALTGTEPLESLLRRRATLTSADRDFLRGNYQSEVAYLDASMGRFLDALKERGLYERAWIVFTSDHGEEILDRGWIGHSVTLHDELVHVPLIVKPPRGVETSAAVRSEYVSLVDLPATLHEMATKREPARATLELGHSRSLVRTLTQGTKPERRWLYLHTDFVPVVKDELSDEKTAHQWGVLDGESGWKWIVDHRRRSNGALAAKLYDVGERRDPSSDPDAAEVVRAMQRLRALVPRPLGEGERLAPAWLPEEPWGPRDASASGFGPGFPAGER